MRLKLLIHSNAPWSPSGYGQQVALFAPRLAEHTDLAISAFHGLANAPLNVAGLTIYPGSGAGLGERRRRRPTPSATSAACAADSCSAWSTSSCSTPAVWSELNAASWVPVDHDPAPPAVLGFFAVDGRRADRDVALRPGAAAPASTRSTSRTASPPTSPAAAARRARAAAGIPRDAFVVGIVAVNKGAPVAQVARRDDRGVRDLPRAPRRRAALPPHRVPGRASAGRTCRRCSTSSACRRRPCSSSTSAATSSHPFTPEEMAGDLLVARRAAERVDGRGLRAARCSRRRRAACPRSSPTSRR